MACYDNINGVLRKVDKIYDNVGGVLREVSRGYDNIGGTLREYHSAGTPLNELSVGTTAKIRVNGTLRDWIIVQQGRPSDMYDISCNGTWLLMKDCYEIQQWHSSDLNDYANSTIHSYLNSTFLNLFNADIKAAIKQVKIPYRPGSGSSNGVNSGASGLSCKVFLLSGYEVGFTTSISLSFPVDGAKLSYFISGYDASARAKRIANRNGSTAVWWLRSPSTHGSLCAWLVESDGGCSYGSCSSTNNDAVRPALILPTSIAVAENGEIIV